MFSFHKPKIYRSMSGCCICRAKSSSSRFTDSSKYERDFDKCFRIREERAGEICNACVLLVKRWKKLPEGTNRHWHHVVDARAGPGTKSALKIKNKSPIKFKKHKTKKLKVKRPQYPIIPCPSPISDEFSGEDSCDRTLQFSRKFSLDFSDESDNEDSNHVSRGKHCKRSPSKDRISSFLDLTYWKKTQVCCGIIFKGINGEVLVDPRLLKPCFSCRSQDAGSKSEIHRSQSVETESNASSNSYNDNDFLEMKSVDSEQGTPSSFSIDSHETAAAFALERLTCAASKLEASYTHRALAMEC
ncbi:SIN3-HDAC complex-associated factor-like [Gigantopelta aegis]|uniref:SIN3-HDAC complex-associated factor-like n=1 Tax=Gigantopelta aegis TaxID=1735272 RepID=UPI001B88C6DF|nr:SIN3-HDAC complex-associated factor-like [Gigantopelta aegis]XP_041355122.1 SIN3-HDAC complex-associated factor-like [Gigantopelta aegis]